MIFKSVRSTEEKLNYVRNNQPVLLVAFKENKPVGFKLGYVIPGTQTLFSWLGGVHSLHRRSGIGQHLLERQEALARDMGLDKIYFTSYDRYKPMIRLGEKNGYELIKAETDAGEMKYWYQKNLCSGVLG